MKNPFTIKLQAGVLLAGELILLVTSALWDELDPDIRWPAWLYITVFAAGGYALAGSRKWLLTYLLLSVSAMLFSSFENVILTHVVGTACFGFAFAMLFQAIVKHCFFRRSVSPVDRVLAGITGYLLLGFFWTSQSKWAELVKADAFINVRADRVATEAEKLYFSFVSLTSLGYGDIVPTSAVARLIAILNCSSGVLYLAIFISALVGNLAANRHRDTDG